MFNELDSTKPLPVGVRWVCAAGAAALTLTLVAMVFFAGAPASGLSGEVATRLPQSGVENPVTAVLLNFRSYDTLLEIAVLLVVVVALVPAGTTSANSADWFTSLRLGAVDPMSVGFAGLLAPIIVVVAGYLLWVGAYRPGGAFQAGALLAATGILLSLIARQMPNFCRLPARLLLVAGLLVFILVGLIVSLATGAFLHFPQDFAGVLILLIEAAATLSIAAALLLFYSGLAQTEPAR